MNVVPRSVPQDSNTIKTTLPYNRKYVLFAIYEVLDKKGAEYEKINATTILSEISVYGNTSRFSLSADEQPFGTELTITMVRPCEGLSPSGVHRSVTAVADSISQHLENELVINKLKA